MATPIGYGLTEEEKGKGSPFFTNRAAAPVMTDAVSTALAVPTREETRLKNAPAAPAANNFNPIPPAADVNTMPIETAAATPSGTQQPGESMADYKKRLRGMVDSGTYVAPARSSIASSIASGIVDAGSRLLGGPGFGSLGPNKPPTAAPTAATVVAPSTATAPDTTRDLDAGEGVNVPVTAAAQPTIENYTPPAGWTLYGMKDDKGKVKVPQGTMPTIYKIDKGEKGEPRINAMGLTQFAPKQPSFEQLMEERIGEAVGQFRQGRGITKGETALLGDYVKGKYGLAGDKLKGDWRADALKEGNEIKREALEANKEQKGVMAEERSRQNFAKRLQTFGNIVKDENGNQMVDYSEYLLGQVLDNPKGIHAEWKDEADKLKSGYEDFVQRSFKNSPKLKDTPEVRRALRRVYLNPPK